MDATYVSATEFTVVGDQTAIFLTGRRVKCDCAGDGYKYGTISSSAYTDKTTITLTAASDDLTDNLASVEWGVVIPASVPVHKTSHQDGGTDEIDVTGLVGATPGAILGDGVAGRVFRCSRLFIKNGTNDSTLKCQILNRWNGDVIAETDNIAKDGTVGDFTLSADGFTLTVDGSALSGAPLLIFPSIYYNASGTDLTPDLYITTGNIIINLYASTSAATPDLTTLVDTGQISLNILYITDA